MGQRHQLFIIAQVRRSSGQAKKYRCVAAFHHQWCYGKLPLRCVNRFKQLARVKENADLIQRDLDQYHEGLQHSPAIPCPYISFLAGAAFTTDISEVDGHHFSQIHYLPTSMGSMDGDNNEGITIIDVSTPDCPSYSFVSFCGLEVTEDLDPERCVPLTAEQYLRAYYPEVNDPLAADRVHEAEVYNTRAIRNLDDMPLLTLDVLAATWPHEYKAEVDSGATDVDSGAVLDQSSSGPGAPAPYHKSLVDLSKQGLASTDLLRMLKDRAPFTHLDISHNEAVDKATLSQILKEHPLVWLNIDGCNVSSADLADLLSNDASLFRGVEAIIHPAFLSRENLLGEGTNGIPNVFRFYYGDRMRMIRPAGSPWLSLPFFGIDQLVQNLLDAFDAYEKAFITERPPCSNLRSILGSCYREEGQSWATRAVQSIPSKHPRGTLDDGYTFIFFASETWMDPTEGSPLKKFEYGIVLPENTKEFVDITRFLKHLEDEGWPKPKNGDAVDRLVGKFNEATGPGLLKDVSSAMKRVRSGI